MNQAKISTADYLLIRLAELGITDIFGVPGDYNLTFLDHIIAFKNMRWVGNCNELNAAYAADGYARVRGAAALVTTFGVGELSAINGIAGSFAEYLPVVNIVGAPSTQLQREHAIVHHTFGTGDFGVFINMFEHVSAAVVILNSPEKNAQFIDHALETCWIKKQPVYISLPSDMVEVQIPVPVKPLNLNYPTSNQDVVAELAQRTAALVRQAKNPIILADLCADRHHMQDLILDLLKHTNIPFALMNLGKGIINESHPLFIGLYNGNYSTPGVQERIEHADCVISFGTMMSDFNTGIFTSKINENISIEIHSHFVKVQHALYPNVYFNAVVPALTKALQGYRYSGPIVRPVRPDVPKPQAFISQNYFWSTIVDYLKPHDIIIAETGTSMFGLLEIPMPDAITFVAQALWGSIGYATGALLGTALADTTRRSLLFTGDGSFQLTAQEVSTMLRHHLTPIIFLLNNQGYTIERVIHGPKMIYNDIQPWQYSALPAIFGENVYAVKVTTEGELAAALEASKQHADQLCFIEVMMKPDDCPESLRKLGKACETNNKGK